MMMYNEKVTRKNLNELTADENLRVLNAVRTDLKFKKQSNGYRSLDGKIQVSNGKVKDHAKGYNLFSIVKDASNLSKDIEVFNEIYNILGYNSNSYEYKQVPKKSPEVKAPALNIDIDKPSLNVLYQFLSTKLSNDIETQDLYKELYKNKRNLVLNSDFLPLKPNYLNEFRTKNPKEYNLLKSFLNISFHHRLIQFHRNFNNELDYFTGYLFKDNYEKYSNKDYDYKSSIKPKGINNSKVYGRNSLNKPQIKDNLFFITESVDKAEALIQLGYSSIGLNGINNLKALDSALLELKNKIDSDNLETVILLDSKQGIITNETKSIIQIAEKLQSLNIRFSIASIKKPKIGSKNKDIDINDLLINIKLQKTKLKVITELLNKRVSFEVFSKNLGRNKNLDNENIFRNAIKAAAGSKAIKSYDRLTIDEIRNQGLLFKEMNEFIINYDKKTLELSLLIVKATAGSGKTYSILELSRKKKILYLTSNTSLINDLIISAKDKYLKVHYQKSYSQQCKDNHDEQNIDFKSKDSFFSKFKNAVSKDLDTKKLCSKCPLKSTCKAVTHQQQFSSWNLKNNTNILAMTIDKYVFSDNQTNEAIDSFRPEIIVIDETMHLVKEITINNKQTLKPIEKYIVNQSDNENLKTLFNLVETILKDLPKDETMKRGKALFDYLNKNYTGFKQLISSLSIDEIKESINKLELEDFLDTEDLPDKKVLIEVLSSLKKDCKNIIVKDDEIVISTKKKFNLPDNLPIIHLDASAKLSLVSKELNIPEDKISFVDFKGFNPNLKIFQYSDSSNKNSALIKGSYKYERLVSLIKNKVLIENKKTLVVVSYELENIMRKEDTNLKECFDSNNLVIEHHYNLRGRNDFKDYDVAIVTAPKINYKALESMAYTLYGIDKFEMEHKTIQTNIYHEPTGTYLKLENSRVYTNDLMNDVVQKFQADEINQCCKRIDRKGNESKEIIILDQIDMTNVFYEDIQTFDFDYQKKKNKSKTDSLKNLLKELLESSKENNDFILYSDLENLILKDNEKNNNYGFQIAETLTNSSLSKFSYNIYNHITNLLQTNDYGTFSRPSFKNALKTAIIETGFSEKTINLCFDTKNYIPLKFLFSDNEKFSTIETILKDKFKFVKPEVKAPALENLSEIIKELVINKNEVDILEHTKQLKFNALKKDIYKYMASLSICDFIGYDEKFECNVLSFDYFYTDNEPENIKLICSKFNLDSTMSNYFLNTFVKEYTFDEKELINQKIKLKQDNKIISFIDFKEKVTNKSKDELYIDNLTKDIYSFISSSNINSYIDFKTKKWSSYFKELNNGSQYLFFIKNISLRFNIHSDLSVILFDSYPSTLNALIECI